MIYKNKDIEYLFENLKSGDFFAFYKKPWYYLFSKLIRLITGYKISHVAGVFDVKRRGNILSFKVGEQVFTSGKDVEKYSITKNEDVYSIDSRFRKKHIDFYLLVNKYKLKPAQNKEVRNYWNESEDYSLEELPFTVNWFYNLFGKKNKVYDNNCSTATRQSMLRVGIKDTKFDDKVPNPTEFAKFSYIKEIIKINNVEN